MHGAPGEPEGVLPGSIIGDARPAKTDYPTCGSDVIVVAESGLIEVDRGAAGATLADAGLRQLSHRGGIDFDENGCGAIIAADDEGCAVGDIDNRRGQDTLADGACSNRERC